MASPNLRMAVRTGAAHLDRMAEELAAFERDGRVTEPAYADLQHRFELLGGYTLDQRVDSALSGLGFARDEWAKPPTALSGGEQTRASLARLVIADPDLLMLDEPTNHLDLDALEWLEEHLRRRAGLAAGRLARPGVPGRHGHPGLGTARPSPDRVPWRLQLVPPPARGARRPDGQGRRDARRADRPRARAHPALSKPPQVQQDARARGSPREAPGRAEGGPEGRSQAGHPGRVPGGRRPVAVRRDRRAGRRASPSATCRVAARWPRTGHPRPRRRIVARAPFLAAQRGERIGIVGPNGAGKTTLLRTIAGDLPAAGRVVDLRARGPARVPRPAARGGDRRDDRPRRPDRGVSGHPGRGSVLPRPVPVPRRRRPQGGAPPVRRRAVAPRTGAARHPAVEPAPARRTDEPPRHPGTRGDRGVHDRVARDAAGRVARPAVARDGVRQAVGRGRRRRGRVRWRLSGLADGGRRRVDRRQRPRGPGGAARRRTDERGRTRTDARLPATKPPPPRRRRVDREGQARAEALQGRLSTSARRGRGGPHPARPAQEPSRAGARRSRGGRELRRDAAGSRASWRTSARPSPPPRMRGWTSRSEHRDRSGDLERRVCAAVPSASV